MERGERTTERPKDRAAERTTERPTGAREGGKPGFLAKMGSWMPLFALGCVSLVVGIIALAGLALFALHQAMSPG